MPCLGPGGGKVGDTGEGEGKRQLALPGVAGPLLWPQGRVGTAPCSIAAEEQPVWGQELPSPRGTCPAGRRVNCQPSSQFTSINNFAKTNIYCAFLGSEKANFHFSSSSSTSPLNSFPQPLPPSPAITSKDAHHQRHQAASESQAVTSSSRQEPPLGVPSGIRLAFQTGGHTGSTMWTFQGSPTRVVPLLIPERI